MTTHEILSFIMFALAAGAAWSAWWAMKRGLGHSAVAATVAVLVLVGLSNLAHFTDEVLGLGLIDNNIDHLIAVLGYAAFIWLIIKAGQVKTA